MSTLALTHAWARRACMALALALGCAASNAAKAEEVLRVWGHGSLHEDFVGPLLRRWQAGFNKQHPQVRFENTLRGDVTAIGGLYTGAADIAFMQRPPSAIELDGYRPVVGHDPFGIAVASGSVGVRHHAPALVVYVHRGNPLARLTLAQLDAIVSADHRRSAAPIRHWGELGLTGAWAHRPITVYTAAIASDESQFVEQAVMAGSQKWTGELREFSDRRGPDGKLVDAGQQTLQALALDRFGMAIASGANQHPQTKPLALAADDASPARLATRQTVAQRRYPLARTVWIFVNRAPGQPLPPSLKAFLHYVLSREGQAAVARDGRYLPLTPEMARRERDKLE